MQELMIDSRIQDEIMPYKEQALALVVKTPEDKQFGGNMLIEMGNWEKKVKEWFAPLKETAHQAHKAICDKEKEQLNRATEIRQIIAPKLQAYDREEQRKIELAKAKEIDAYHKAQEEARIKAEKLCKQGKQEQAAEILTNVKVPVVNIPEPTKVQGLAEVEDIEITIVNADLIPREYCKPDESLIKKAIKLFGKPIQGVTYKKIITYRRTGR